MLIRRGLDGPHEARRSAEIAIHEKGVSQQVDGLLGEPAESLGRPVVAVGVSRAMLVTNGKTHPSLRCPALASCRMNKSTGRLPLSTPRWKTANTRSLFLLPTRYDDVPHRYDEVMSRTTNVSSARCLSNSCLSSRSSNTSLGPMIVSVKTMSKLSSTPLDATKSTTDAT